MGYLWSQALFILLLCTFNSLYVQAQTDGENADLTPSADGSGNGNGAADSDGSADRDTNALALKAPSQIEWCSTVDLTWASGTPLYEVYYARGTGAIGEESALGAEQRLGSVQDLKFSWHVTSEWTIPGDTVRLRVQDDQGHGINGTVWAAVVAGNDMSCGNPTSVGPTNTNQQSSSTVPPRPTHRGGADNLPGSSDTSRPTDTSITITTGIATTNDRGVTTTGTSAQPPATTFTADNLPFPADDGNDGGSRNREGSNSDSFNPSDSSESGNGSGGGSPVLNNDDSPMRTGNIDSNGADSNSDSPTNASGGTGSTKKASISSSTVGAIIGSMIGVLVILIGYLFWRRWKQQKNAHFRLEDDYGRPMSEAERGRASHYSPFSVVTPNPPSRGNSARSNPYSQHSHSHSHSHSPSHPVITPEPGSGTFADDASLVSYNGAAGPGVYSPLDTPDPFRSVTFPGQVPFLNLNQSSDSTPHAL